MINIRSVRKETWILILLIVLGLFLRSFLLDSKPLWGDEIYSLDVSTPPILETFNEMITGDGGTDYPQLFYTPPLYYVMLHFALAFTENIFILKFLFSVIPGVLIIPVVYFFMKRMFNERAGLIAALLVAVAPTAIVLSQLLRYYPLHTLFTLLSLFSLYLLIERNEKKYWVLFIASNALNLYTHYFAVFVILGEVLFFLYIRNRFISKKGFFISMVVILLLFLPWMFMFVNQLPNFEGGPTKLTKTAPIDSLLYTSYKIPLGIRRPALVDWKIVGLVFLPVFYLVFLYGILRTRKQDGRKICLLLTILFTVVLSPILINLATPDMYKIPLLISRYQWFLFPLYFMVVSAGLSFMNKKAATLILVLFMVVYAYLLYDYYFLISKENWAYLVGV